MKLNFKVGLNSIYFETIEKQYKYYTNLTCHGLCLLAAWLGKWRRVSCILRIRVFDKEYCTGIILPKSMLN